MVRILAQPRADPRVNCVSLSGSTAPDYIPVMLTEPAPSRRRAAPANLPQLLSLIEASDVRAKQQHWALIPPELAVKLRARTSPVADGFMTLAAKSDSLRMNRVIGLGHRGEASERAIEETIAFYRAAKLRRFSMMLSPGPQSEQITRWLVARGFVRHGGHALLVRDGRLPVARVTSELRIARSTRQTATVVTAIHQRAFATPASRREWALASVRSADSNHYLAYVGSTPVAVGTLRIDGELAWLGGAATLTRWRRHGAHGALISARLRSAARRGCRWAWVETIAPAPGRPGGSRRNLLRLGFEEVCIKPLFVWHAG